MFLLVVGVFFLAPSTSGGNLGWWSDGWSWSFGISSSGGGWYFGMSPGRENYDCVVSVSASLASVVFALSMLAFLAFYVQNDSAIDSSKMVGAWRRLGAFMLDFVVVLIVIVPLATLPLLMTEARHSGIFQWSFERNFSRSTDSIYLLAGTWVPLAMFCYFYIHLRVNRQTVGQYVLGYRVVGVADMDRAPKYGLRIIMSVLGVCVLPVSAVLAWSNPQGKFWWDSLTGMRAVRLFTANKRMERSRDG